MSGRHAVKATSFTALSDSKVRTAAVALAAGAMFGAALPAGATTNGSSGAQASADLAVSNDTENTTAVDDVVVLGSGSAGSSMGELAVEDSTTADNVALSLDVQLPAAQTPTNTQTNTAASAAPVHTNIAPPAEAGSIVAYARQFVGTPYVWGGTTPAGFDCSGFTQYVFAQFGYSLPRTAGAQGAAGHRVSAAEAQPGDLVVWGSRHVGIYTGNGMHIAAHKPGVPLSETALYGSYYFVRIG